MAFGLRSKDGQVQEVRFPNADPKFNDQTIEGFEGGVVLDVDQFDFALPGGVDENDNALIGGLLIWHIDENRLVTRLNDNSVNADPEKRAIDLEEADGAQDIGYSSGASFSALATIWARPLIFGSKATPYWCVLRLVRYSVIREPLWGRTPTRQA